MINIIHDGFYREVGPGENRMKEVLGCSVEGVYCTDRPDSALESISYIASGGPVGKAGCVGSELISEDGTIPLKVVIRCLADSTGLLWRREEKERRLFCYMPDALFITHIYVVGQHPHTVWFGTTQVTAEFTHVEGRTPAGEIPPLNEHPLSCGRSKIRNSSSRTTVPPIGISMPAHSCTVLTTLASMDL
ncbi:MAG: hypothetical protein ACKPKO_29780, partial [Candidatus Fonsibacter sp.]